MSQFPFKAQSKLVQALAGELRNSLEFSSARVSCKAFAEIMNCALWASTLTEEGEEVRAVLSIGPAQQYLADPHIKFDRALPLTSQAIAKLSVSFPYGRGALGVSPAFGQPKIWGFYLGRIPSEWVLEILGPGFLVVRNERGVRAVVQPDGNLLEFHSVQPTSDMWCDFLMFETTINNLIPSERQAQFLGLLRIAASSMRNHGCGGTLILGPDSGNWLDSVKFGHRVAEGQNILSEKMDSFRAWAAELPRDQLIEDLFLPESEAQSELHTTLRLVAGLSAVDGALILTYNLEFLGYGAKLQATPRDAQVRVLYPTGEPGGEIVKSSKLGGTRHQSAVHFVAAHPETLACVASQDGRFTVFCCGPDGEDVRAFRSELLLLEDWPGEQSVDV